MPRFEPFRGLRYRPGAVRLNQVVAPPYDVVGPAQRSTLAARSPYNAIRVELPEADLHRGLDRYRVAAELLAAWTARSVLVADPAPALYPYRMTSPEGRTSTGVIGALEVGADDVLPHEQTMPKPRSDRLDLLRATGANLSPIWGLSPAAGLSATFAPSGPPAGDAYDDDGVRHQIWVLDHPDAVDEVARAVAGAPVVVADGHHRYETARAYREEAGPGPADLVMALVVELTEEQLTVGAIHRAVAGLPPGTDVPATAGRWFDALRAGPATGRVVSALGGSGSLALVTPEGAWLLTPRPEAYEAAGSDLDSSLVDLVLAELPPHEATHRHSWEEAWSAVEGGEAQAAFLLRPASVAQIAEWAAARRRMPPKTTYFSPKPRTGMVFRQLTTGG
ncbi:MAG: DUF1015 family protein [Acidimicrobiales bacterium]